MENDENENGGIENVIGWLLNLILLILLIMTLWNAILPDLFGLPRLNFPQAAGIYMLSNILIGRWTDSGDENPAR